MRTLLLLPLLSLAACDHWILVNHHDGPRPTHEVTVETSPWSPGGVASVSVALAEPRSNKPARGRVTLLLDERKLAMAETDDAGRAEFIVDAPDSPGTHRLSVLSITSIDSRRDEVTIQVVRPRSFFFALDRPILQPGHAIHLRALAFREDKSVDAGAEITFEITDPAGNRVFREKSTTSDFGVAHATFKIPEEVALGPYRAVASMSDRALEASFAVKRYTLPKFRTEILTDQAFVLDGETLRGSIRSRYTFGEPLAKATFDIHAETEEGEFARLSIAPDADGRADFSFDIRGGRFVRIHVEVTDSAKHTEVASLIVPVSKAPLLIHAVPVCDRVVPGFENPLRVFVTAADGGPAEAEVTAEGKTVTTDHLGTATMIVRSARVKIAVRDGRGRKAERVIDLPRGRGMILTPSRRAPKAGETISVDIRSLDDGRFTLRFANNGRTIGTRDVVVANGRGRGEFTIPKDGDGVLSIRCGEATALAWIRGPRRLDVKVLPAADVVKPGEDMAVRFVVKDADGRPARAALGLAILDRALWGLAEMDAEADLAAFAVGQLASGHAAKALWTETDDARAEALAALVLAGRAAGNRSVAYSSRRHW